MPTKEQYAADPERYRAIQRAYRARNVARVRAQERANRDRRKDRVRAQDRARYASGQKKDYHFRRRYGISLDDYYVMVERQEGRCRVCSKVYGAKLFVDHCHRTGRVRGLLCRSCNTLLGWYENYLPKITAHLEEKFK